MIVRMKTKSAGPKGNREIGQVCTVDEAEGKALVDGGYAEEVKSADIAEASEVEAAVMPEPENAATRVRPIVKKRGR